MSLFLNLQNSVSLFSVFFDRLLRTIKIILKEQHRKRFYCSRKKEKQLFRNVNLSVLLLKTHFCPALVTRWWLVDVLRFVERYKNSKTAMASPPEMTEMYDNALLGILQHVGNIQDFLRVYFGFLYRKTDFYRLLSGPVDKMGFPPGVAEKMVLKVKFDSMTATQTQESLKSLP